MSLASHGRQTPLFLQPRGLALAGLNDKVPIGRRRVHRLRCHDARRPDGAIHLLIAVADHAGGSAAPSATICGPGHPVEGCRGSARHRQRACERLPQVNLRALAAAVCLSGWRAFGVGSDRHLPWSDPSRLGLRRATLQSALGPESRALARRRGVSHQVVRRDSVTPTGLFVHRSGRLAQGCRIRRGHAGALSAHLLRIERFIDLDFPAPAPRVAPGCAPRSPRRRNRGPARLHGRPAPPH